MKKSIGLLTNDNAKPSTSIAYQRGTTRDGSPHYVFLYDDDDDENNYGNDSNYVENISLQSRRNKSDKNNFPQKIEVINVTLKPEDSLQSLAVKYRCTMSELKRINNIHKENEIFARRTLKVPVQRFSILTETNDDDDDDVNNQEKNKFPSIATGIIGVKDSIASGDEVNNEARELTVHPPSSSLNDNVDDINSIIFNSLSNEPFQSNLPDDILEVNNSENDRLLLTNQPYDNFASEAYIVDWFCCSRGDWSWTWLHLLCASLFICFILSSLFYIMYLHEKYSQPHNSTEESVS